MRDLLLTHVTLIIIPLTGANLQYKKLFWAWRLTVVSPKKTYIREPLSIFVDSFGPDHLESTIFEIID